MYVRDFSDKQKDEMCREYSARCPEKLFGYKDANGNMHYYRGGKEI